MIDLHCHILPGIDDGAVDLAAAFAMARTAAADGIVVIACTPHIFSGVFNNEGPQIRAAVNQLQQRLDEEGIELYLVPGADNHITPDFASRLKSGRLLTLGNSRYVLVEPPHHVAPPRLDDFFSRLIAAGFAPILTHPERLSWIETHYPVICQLVRSGVWMQITAASLTGSFGRIPRYWAERMLDEGRVHIIASDAHDIDGRSPNLSGARECAARRVGADEAEHLVVTRPRGILENVAPSCLPLPALALAS